MTDDAVRAAPGAVFLGLYPLDPALRDPVAVRQALVAHPDVAGIELPWLGLDDTLALADRVLGAAPHWRLQITGIPATMRSLADEPGRGLAATDERMRAAAVATAREQLAAVRAIERRWGSGRVAAVLLHSAPRGGSAASLRRSLEQLLAEDRGAAELLLEHVDAPQPGREPAKGFLPLDDELAVAAELGVGVAVNWGRSAIELRDPDAVTRHLAAARAAGVLRAVVLSGAADVDGAFGPAWSDAHLPPTASAPESLLTAERIRSAIDAAGAGVLLGAKFGWRGDDAGAVTMLESALDVAAVRAPTRA